MNKINKLCSLLNNNSNKVLSLSMQVHGINRNASDAASSGDENAPCTIAHLYSHWTKQFVNAGISEPQQSTQYIFSHVLNIEKISDLYLKFANKVDQKSQDKIEILCGKRLLKMPVQYILGEWQFRDLTLKMQPPVFIPRPETEMLIDLIQDDFKGTKNKTNILEICCGTGAISLSLLKLNSNFEVTAIDKSEDACCLTEKNAFLHGLNNRISIRKYEINDGNILQDISTKFDLIVSNPPYVPSKDVEAVQPEIRLYEDLDALDGGPDGLKLIKPILLISKEKLRHGGKLYLETDPSHPIKISHYLENNPQLKLKFIKSYKDFCNKDRFVKIEKI